MRPRAQNLLLLGSLLVAALLAEATLRRVDFSYPNFYRQDLQIGAALRPGAQGWWREEGESFVSINAAGMSDDREIAAFKGKDVLRIAVLGNSYAEALRVSVQQTFWRLTDAHIDQLPTWG